MKIVITGHGHFATGLQTTVELLAGPQSSLDYVNFSDGMDEDGIYAELSKAVRDEGSVVFFTDLLGGTPFKQAVTISVESSADIAVVAGCNVASLLEVTPLLSNYSGTAEQLADQLVSTSQTATTHFRLKKVSDESPDADDGI